MRRTSWLTWLALFGFVLTLAGCTSKPTSTPIPANSEPPKQTTRVMPELEKKP